jgi:hypothetical protein
MHSEKAVNKGSVRLEGLFRITKIRLDGDHGVSITISDSNNKVIRRWPSA